MSGPRVWSVPHHYKLGEHAIWQGVDLVCTRDHYAGDAAEHPWDPGDGWVVEKAAALWSPNGPAEAEKLRHLLAFWSPTVGGDPNDRLAALLTEATGP